MEILEYVVFWHWWVAAIIFISIEIFAPSMVTLWFGIAAALVGVISYMFPDFSWQYQFIVWSILSLLTVVGWHFYRKSNPPRETDQPTLNKRGEQYLSLIHI